MRKPASLCLLGLATCSGLVLQHQVMLSGSTCSVAPRAPTAHIVAVKSADEQQGELTPSMVAELLEATFVNACMDLAKGYVDTLKLFIASAKSSYTMGLTIPAMEMELAACERQTANRPLMQEETELRRLWLCLVYLTLEELGQAGAAPEVGDSVPADLKEKYGPFVRNVVSAKARGATLQSLKLDALLDTTAPRSAMETAILSQSMRLCFLAMVVVDEERLASGEDEPPKPFIPGA